MDAYLHHRHHHRLEFSPIIIGLLGIFAGAIMVATYHCIAGSCCFRRQNGQSLPDRHQNSDPVSNQERNSRSRSNASVAMASIPVSSYGKDCNEGMCSVCLSEFNEGERIRVLPECLHLFHVECIDKWLTSHSNCPLCRADIIPPQHSVWTLPDSGENEIPPREFHPVPFGV